VFIMKPANMTSPSGRPRPGPGGSCGDLVASGVLRG
jgi:hypothetical protein